MASFRPGGRLFDGSTIAPDIVAWPRISDLTGETDSQLDRAVATLQGP